jgi:Na+/proline symporter
MFIDTCMHTKYMNNKDYFEGLVPPHIEVQHDAAQVTNKMLQIRHAESFSLQKAHPMLVVTTWISLILGTATFIIQFNTTMSCKSANNDPNKSFL